MKDLLRRTFAATLELLAGRLREWTPRCAGAARAHADAGGQVLVIAFGKAARAMAEPLLQVLPRQRTRGLLVVPEPEPAPLPPLATIAAGHPLPTAGSFAAAERALALCRTATAADHVVFLVSGGGSALLERPLDGAATVDEWRAFYRALVGCGARIDRINAIRRRLSDVKGGRLALAARAAAGQTTIVVRDVPGPIEDVASGPSCSFDHEPDTLAADLTAHGLLDALPAALRARVLSGAVPPLPELPPQVLSHAAWLTVLDEGEALRQALHQLATAGLVVEEAPSVDDLPIPAALDVLLPRLLELRHRHPGRRVALVATGELSVPLPPSPGTGGRNQQFALAAALRIAGQPITVLSCGTDGVDGNSPAAGAIVDGTTIARAQAAGFDPDAALRRCDAFPLLAAIGDAVVTGPTGANVRDLRMLVHDA